MDWRLDHAGVGAGARLLDIGCGWGGLMARAVHARGVAQVTGLTLSETQAAYVIENGPPRARVLRQSWAAHETATPYDAIISIGAFEHFAEPGLSRSARIAAYEAFFAKCAALLAPGGRLSLQTIAYPADFDRQRYDASDYGAFVRTRIFPDSDLPDAGEILAAAGARFELETLRNDRRHYAETTRRWRSALLARRDDSIALVGAARVDDMDRCFRVSIGAFELGALQLLRMGFRRITARAGR